jgi:hypothetical protein
MLQAVSLRSTDPQLLTSIDYCVMVSVPYSLSLSPVDVITFCIRGKHSTREMHIDLQFMFTAF